MTIVTLSDNAPSAPPNAEVETSAERVARLNDNVRSRLNVIPLGQPSDRPPLSILVDEASATLNEAINGEFKKRIALVSSFGAESAVLLHLAASVAPDVPILFLETGKHFAQTLSYRKKLANEFGLSNVQDIRPDPDVLRAQDPAGDLWRRNPDACCDVRKVRPLTTVLEGFDAWITGRKQFHGGARMTLPVYEETKKHIKVNPIVRWAQEDVSAYFDQHELPAHPLVAEGFPSIGCWPCTKPAVDGEDVRSGRWQGSEKTECGIHTV
ncbi:MAG: phosphoadenylyl-sulfate reductase [Pseudomonadota bacterium]